MRIHRTSVILTAAVIAGGTLTAPGVAAHDRDHRSRDRLQHLVVIYLENHSFDNLYGLFKGANGIRRADAAHTVQVALDGTPLKCLPQNDPHLTSPPLPADECSVAAGDPFDSHFANEPFNIDQYIPTTEMTEDLNHRFYQNQVQINGGLNNKFTTVSTAQGLTQGYYDTRNLPLAKLARRYTLADNFFQAAFGGSYLNHQWLICACTPVWPNAPRARHIVLDPATGLPVAGQDDIVVPAPEEFAVNTVQSANLHEATLPVARQLPSQTLPTIGDRLDEAGVSWAWYSGGWNDALAGTPDPLFQFHHQPFAYYENYKPGSPGAATHLKDESEFLDSARNGTLPAVSFVKPIGAENEHPGYADVARGEQHVLDLVHALRQGDWRHTAVIVTYDEFGGFWDHAPPPVIDRWGPGTRIPAIIISKFARKHFVDHRMYDTTSILALIEARWDLAPLTDRDAAAADLQHAFRIRLDR